MDINYNSNNSGKPAGGVGFAGLLQILFIALKLCKVIDWSWVWVLAPLWISFSLVITIIIIIIIVFNVKMKEKHW